MVLKEQTNKFRSLGNYMTIFSILGITCQPQTLTRPSRSQKMQILV